MNKNRIIKSLLSLIILLSLTFSLTACFSDEKEYDLYLDYPQDMKDRGFNKPVGLDAKPERAVILTAGPDLVLHELGVGIAGYYKSVVVNTPQEVVDTAVAFGDMDSTFDTEAVVILNPDLVIMLYTNQEKFGKTFENLGIPVYYVNGAHGIAYDSVKMQTQSFIDAFADNDTIEDELMSRFTAVETRMDLAADKYKDLQILVMMSAFFGENVLHYVQTGNGSLRNMFDMIGFTTIGAEGIDSAGMISLDKEYALANWNPDYIFFATMQSEYDDAEEEASLMTTGNSDKDGFWSEFSKDMSGEIIGLPVLFTSAGGIQIVDAINELMDYLQNLLGY